MHATRGELNKLYAIRRKAAEGFQHQVLSALAMKSGCHPCIKVQTRFTKLAMASAGLLLFVFYALNLFLPARRGYVSTIAQLCAFLAQARW